MDPATLHSLHTAQDTINAVRDHMSHTIQEADITRDELRNRLVAFSDALAEAAIDIADARAVITNVRREDTTT